MTKVGDVVTLCSKKNGSAKIDECNALVTAVWSNSAERCINCISVRLVAEVSYKGHRITMGREEPWTKVPHATHRWYAGSGDRDEHRQWWI
jgi:hypothetical protein